MPESINPKKLKNKAIHYLSRFSSTEKNLTQILLKFTKKKCPEIELYEALKYINETVVWCRENGYVNNYEYLVMKIRTGRLKGESAKQITKKLLNAGLSKSLIFRTLKEDENFFETEFEAALTMARKKRIGPFAHNPITNQVERNRQMARLARAGFNYEICKNVFDYLDET